MEFLLNTNYDFMKYRKFWVVVSLILVGVGVFAVFIHGQLNVGIDFAGGTQVIVKFRQPPNVERLREILSTQGLEPQIQSFGEEEDHSVVIKTRLVKGQVEGSRGLIVRALEQGLGPKTFTVTAVENVGPQIGEELRQQGFWAVILSLIGMLVYIWIRFELRFGIGAIMACIHDVLVTLGLYALFDYEFNLTTVAAFLTLIGYSVNDTVVIFDRIRENMRKSRRKPLIETMNESINQTLSRTILTGGSTLLALLALLIWGGDAIRGFAFVMFVGIIIGTYSSIYVASPFALLWEYLFGAGGRWARKKPAVAASRPTEPKPESRLEPRETPARRTRPTRRRRA